MKNKILHIIFPVDPTTDFLSVIIDYLKKNTEFQIIIHRIQDLKEQIEFKNNLKQIVIENSLILFLGHGNSYSLRGPSVLNNNFRKKIKKEEINLLSKNRVIFLSCNSSDYLRDYIKRTEIISGLGFPNLITDEYDILYPDEPDRVNGINKNDIEMFKIILINLVKLSIADIINSDLTFYEFYKRLKLRTQKKIIEIYSGSRNTKTPLGKMMYDLNEGLVFFGKSN